MTQMIEQEPGELALASEFPAATRQQWQRLVAKVLGLAGDPGDAPERALATITADGIEIAPLYVADDERPDPGYPGQAPFVRGRTAAGHRTGWDVRQRHEHPDPAVAREQIMEDLGGGVSSLWLRLGEGLIPVDALPDVLAEVYLDLAAVVLDAGGRFNEAAEAFLGVAARRGIAASALTGCLGADPLGVLARTGAEASLEAAAVLAGRCAAELPGMRAIIVDALPFHEAGGTDAQELGCALAAGTEYLRALRAAGLSGAAAAGQLEFRYAATADQFTTIAKLRAARRAWARVVQQCGIPANASGQRQHAVTSWPMLTRRDPWNNILRGTLACFAAGVGGADAITVTPFDAVIGQPDRLARRVARNVHALLAEESHVASGLIAEQLAVSRQAHRDALARRREAITGVSEFPLIGETLLTRPPHAVADQAGGLPRIRWAQWHEELRDRADAHASATGMPPTGTLVLLDASRASAAQAARVTALLAPAGIATVTVGPEAAAGLAPGAAVVVCGNAEASPDEVRAAAEQARARGASVVFVAGGDAPPGPDGETSPAADGVVSDGVVSKDTDVLAFGEQMLAALEVA
jgi:methylmalonyl-CoA mutase